MSLAIPALFVVTVAGAAVAAIYVTSLGATLCSFGQFTFLPVLYLACETAEGVPASMLGERAMEAVPYAVIDAVPVPVLSVIEMWSRERGRTASFSIFGRILRGPHSEPHGAYIEGMIAIGIAVGTAAAIVEWLGIQYGQWLIWLAASIVTGSVATSRVKWKHRTIGVLVGVPAGVIGGVLVPHDLLFRAAIAFVAALTLIVFRRYVVGFGVRCACAALGFVVVGQSSIHADVRLFNVILGSLIGIAAVLMVNETFKHFLPQSLRQRVLGDL